MVIVYPLDKVNSGPNSTSQNGEGSVSTASWNGLTVTHNPEKKKFSIVACFRCIPIISTIVAPIFIVITMIFEWKLKQIEAGLGFDDPGIKKLKSSLNFDKQMNRASLIPVIGNIYVFNMQKQFKGKSELDNK